MLSNLGNILLFLNVILSLSIIYVANKNDTRNKIYPKKERLY